MSQFLRTMLLILAFAEFFIGLSWILLPKFLCDLFDITYVVDPFWTRATGCSC